MLLLGFLLTIVTFPGVIVHELAHETACDWTGVPVAEVCYFRFGNPAGYAVHAEPARYRHAMAIGVAPFFLNAVLAVAAFAGLALFLPGDGSLEGVGYAGTVLGWLGLSFGLHAFPSTGDATSLWQRTKSRWRTSPSALLGLPVILLIYVVNLLRRLWLDLFYAVALFVLVTELLVGGPIG